MQIESLLQLLELFFETVELYGWIYKHSHDAGEQAQEEYGVSEEKQFRCPRSVIRLCFYFLNLLSFPNFLLSVSKTICGLSQFWQESVLSLWKMQPHKQ